MPALKVEILTSVDSSGLQTATTQLRDLRTAVGETADALQPVADRAAASGDSIAQIGEAAPEAATGLEAVADKAKTAGENLGGAGEKAQWTADQIQAIAPKLSADPLEAYAQAARQAADAIDDDASGLLGFARAATTADQSVKPLAASIKEQGSNASSAGASTEQLAKIAMGLARASQGGREGLMGLAMAGKALWTAMGPAAAVAAGVGVALALINKALAEEEAAAEATRKKIEELDKQKLDNAVKQQKALEDAADLALKKIAAEFSATERLGDAELNRRKSAVDADVTQGKIAPEEGARRKLALDRQREDEKRAALLGAEEAKARTLEDLSAKTTAKATEENAEYERRKKLLDDVTAAQKAYDDAKPDFESSIPAIEQAYGPTAKLAAAKKAAEGTNQKMVDAQKERSDQQQASAEQAQKNAAEARIMADMERKVQKKETPLIQQTRSNEDRSKIPLTDAEKATQEKALEKAQAQNQQRASQLTAGQWRGRIVGGESISPALMEEIRKLYPKSKFPEPRSSSAPLTPTSVDADQSATQPHTPGTMVGPDGRVRTATTTTAGGGTMIGPDGRVIPVPAGGTVIAGGGTGIGPDGRAWTFPTAGAGASTLSMGGQTFTGGAGGLKPTGQGSGSDNKDAKIAEDVKGTTKAIESQSTGENTAKATEELRKAAEKQAEAQKKAAAATEQALSAAADTLSSQASELSNHGSRISRLESQIRAARGKSYA